MVLTKLTTAQGMAPTGMDAGGRKTAYSITRPTDKHTTTTLSHTKTVTSITETTPVVMNNAVEDDYGCVVVSAGDCWFTSTEGEIRRPFLTG